MSIRPIVKETVSDKVYGQLRDNLINGTWKPGDKIPSENELSEAFGVSRVTVRQALSKLITLGLIETRLGEGSYVKEIKPGIYINEMIPHMYLGKESIKEVMEFRQVIEVATVGIAAKKIEEKDTKVLRNIWEQMKEASKREEFDKYVEEDLEFHSYISSITKNSMIIQLNYIVKEIIKESIRNVTESIGTENGLKYHERIIKALEEHDEEEAKRWMSEHMSEAKEYYDTM